MSADLPLLAELEPGPEFTASVMAATRPLRRASIGVRIAETWQRLIERPRFASEGAYVGAFVLLVLFGAPGSPFAGVPGRALAVASINPVEEMREPAAMIEEAVTTEVSAAWSTTRGSVTTTSRAVVGRIQGGISGLLGIFSPGVEDSARPVRERTEPPGGVGRHSDPEERAGNDPNAGDHEAARDHTDGEKR
jgi:hypothetical protein